MTTLDSVMTSRAPPSCAFLLALRAHPKRQEAFAALKRAHPGLVEGRVVEQMGPILYVATADDVVPARIGGGLAYEARDLETLPIVGDFVALAPGGGAGEGRVEAVLPRTALLRRRAAGSETAAQPLAANVDVVFVVVALDGSFSLRRIERALVLAWDSGARPVLVLTKADLSDRVDDVIREVAAVAPAVDILAVSALHDTGLDAVRAALPPGATGVLLGVSGAGKSTLTNRLLGEARFATQPLRFDDRRGLHTTTHRELVSLPHGGLLVDGPGVRELGLVDGVAVDAAFADIGAVAVHCHFRDCTHAGEPGCAVRAAVDAGTLAPDRLEGFHALQREVAFAASRTDPDARRARKAQERGLSRAVREVSLRKRPR